MRVCGHCDEAMGQPLEDALCAGCKVVVHASCLKALCNPPERNEYRAFNHPPPGPVLYVPDDKINHPPHYNAGKIEAIEFIEDQKLDFHLANALKYIVRAGKKGGPDQLVEDLQKAIWYVRRRIEITKENPRRPNDMTEKGNG